MEARDRFDNLKCQVPGCKAVIRALTGLQELEKLRKHMAKAHYAKKNLIEALKTRADWESRNDDR